MFPFGKGEKTLGKVAGGFGIWTWIGMSNFQYVNEVSVKSAL